MFKVKVSEIEYEDLTQDAVDKILFDGIDGIDGIEESQICGDCILVLGSPSAYKYRLPKAVELYNNKRSNKIMVSGGNESLIMKNQLAELGIPPENILIENISSNTAENFICSLYILNREFQITNIKTILLVTTRFHMRRSLMLAEAFMPKWIKIVPCPADDTNTLRHNWFLREKNIKIAKDEAYKIACYIREGCFSDFEI